jgi:hypothetical protein
MEHEASGSSGERAGGAPESGSLRSRRRGAASAAALVAAAAMMGHWAGDALAQPAGMPGAAPVPAVADVSDRRTNESAIASAMGTRLAARSLPNVRSGLLPDVRAKLYESFGLASEKVAQLEPCRALFVRLGSEGADRLRQTLYYPPTPEVLSGRCDKGALAATMRGSSATLLCPAFGMLATRQAAAVLIHEALHFAGLPERPHDRAAMSSTEITNLVKSACGL